jgi:hypothetical protein
LLNDFTHAHADDELTVLGRLAALIVAALKAPLPDTEQLASYVALMQKAGVSSVASSPKLARSESVASTHK